MLYRKTLILIALVSFFACGLHAETYKVLGVGNSFTRNATKYLDDIFESDADNKGVIGLAYIGGCSLERHAQLIKEHEADATTGRKYDFTINGKPQGKGVSLKEMLLAEEWEYITIQQVSTQSYKPETFEPHASELIAYIRQFRPDAEIIVHETWSHSVNSYRAKKGKLDPDEMYTKLHANYAKLANDYGMRIIPVGTAFENARATEMWDLQPDGFDPKNNDLVYPEDKDNLPDMSKSLTADYSWGKNKEGEWNVRSDGFHANSAGEYLGALVWYEFFTGKDARNVTYQPKNLSNAQAESLREVAYETMAGAVPVEVQ
ncbi:MAG: DUF4886 domain-containing protein [Puniceicoccales bacterium]